VLQLLDVRDLERMQQAASRLLERPLLIDSPVFVAHRHLDKEELLWFLHCRSIALLATTIEDDEDAVDRINQKKSIDAKHDCVWAEANVRAAAKTGLQTALAVACARANDGAATWAEVRRQHGLYRRSDARLAQLVRERDALKVRLGPCGIEEDDYDECVFEQVEATARIREEQPDAAEAGMALVCRYCDEFANSCVGGPKLHELLTVYSW
jgi:hypothetical protein